MKPVNRAIIAVTSHDLLGNTGRKTGWYLPEVTHSYYQLKAAGIEVDFVSTKGGKAPMDENSRDLTDEDNRNFLLDGQLLDRLDQTLKPQNVNPQDYTAIIYAGGHGTMWDFPEDQELASLAGKIYDQGGIVGAVCHGPAGLVNIRLSNGKYLVDGKKIATFTNNEEREVELQNVVPFLLETKLRERGAQVLTAPNWSENVVIDERLVTGQNPMSARQVGDEVAKMITQINFGI